MSVCVTCGVACYPCPCCKARLVKMAGELDKVRTTQYSADGPKQAGFDAACRMMRDAIHAAAQPEEESHG